MRHELPLLSHITITDKIVLLRCDFDVALTDRFHIESDERIRCNIPTIETLLQGNNTLILLAKRGDPDGSDPQYSLEPLTHVLPKYLPEGCELTFFPLHPSSLSRTLFQHAQRNELFLLENMRYWPEEKTRDEAYAKHLASLGDVYVNDAFDMSHRNEVTVTGLPLLLPSYAGLGLEHEVSTISSIISNAKKPFVSILGGAKVSKKIRLLYKLVDMSDHVLLAGAVANTFLVGQGINVHASLYDKTCVEQSKEIMTYAKKKKKTIHLPSDVLVSYPDARTAIVSSSGIPPRSAVKDIGPATIKEYKTIMSQAHTIIWNGPAGQAEDDRFAKGTSAIFDTMASLTHVITLIGGGDTTAAIEHEKKSAITHISTGGGALLEYIEKGDLVGLKALREGERVSSI